MKVNIEIDCSPEEARRFLGLPDLAPVHRVYVDQMANMAKDSSSPEALVNTLKTWAPMGEVGLKLWQQMMDQSNRKEPRRGGGKSDTDG